MINNLIKNWKTTSAGLITIAGAVVNLVFAIKNQVDDQGTWMTAITMILTGFGLMFAGDGSASAQAHEETKSMVADLQNQIAVVKQDTATVAKPPGTP